MTRPHSSFRAPAEFKRASEIPRAIPEISTEDAERFWADGTDARSPEPDFDATISPERARLISALLFAAKKLAARFYLPQISACGCCLRLAVDGKQMHASDCEAARVEAIIAELIEVPSRPTPVHRQAAEASDRPRAGVGIIPRVASGGEDDSLYGEPWCYREVSTGNANLENAEGDWIGVFYGPAQEAKDHAERVAVCVNFCAGLPTELLLREKPLASLTRSVNDVIAVGRLLPGLVDLRTSRGVAL